MCRIGLNLTTTVQDGLTVTSATGRYRLQGTSTWTTFSINLTDPRTPDITTNGIYQLQVNISDSSGSVSAWSPNTPATFEISDNCGGVQGPCNFDGNFYYYTLESCDGNTLIFVRSSIVRNIGDVVETLGRAVNGIIIGSDCNQNGIVDIIGDFIRPVNIGCVKWRISNDSRPGGFTMPLYLDCASGLDPNSENEFGGQEVPLGTSIDVCGTSLLGSQIEAEYPGITAINLGACDI